MGIVFWFTSLFLGHFWLFCNRNRKKGRGFGRHPHPRFDKISMFSRFFSDSVLMKIFKTTWESCQLAPLKQASPHLGRSLHEPTMIAIGLSFYHLVIQPSPPSIITILPIIFIWIWIDRNDLLYLERAQHISVPATHPYCGRVTQVAPNPSSADEDD